MSALITVSPGSGFGGACSSANPQISFFFVGLGFTALCPSRLADVFMILFDFIFFWGAGGGGGRGRGDGRGGCRGEWK